MTSIHLRGIITHFIFACCKSVYLNLPCNNGRNFSFNQVYKLRLRLSNDGKFIQTTVVCLQHICIRHTKASMFNMKLSKIYYNVTKVMLTYVTTSSFIHSNLNT